MLIDLPDEQRRLLIVFTSLQWVAIKDDPEMAVEASECEDILHRLHRSMSRVVPQTGATRIDLVDHCSTGTKTVYVGNHVNLIYDANDHLVGVEVLEAAQLHPDLL